jgi:uncharacterized protein with HEPN domain
MSNSEKDLVRLKHILQAINLIQEYTLNVLKEDFFLNTMMQSAVIRQFEIIGEAAKNITTINKENFSDVEWRVLADFRNFLIHEYFVIDEGEVWATVQHNIPTLKEQIETVIQFLEKNN